MKILAIETSCDETACAVVENGVTVISDAIASSAQIHRRWGGIVPELAAREQLSYLIPVLLEAMSPLSDGGSLLQTVTDGIDAIAVTVGPGLNGSLLMGCEGAKTIAYASDKPLIPVNHVLAHMYANFIQTEPDAHHPVEFPAVSLVASGGHTELFLLSDKRNLTWLGGTIDDAAGEAFDKTARLLGFGGGGGKAIEEAAGRVTDQTFIPPLPRPLLHDGTLNFSFSGLKTAVMREWSKLKNPTEKEKDSFAHEVQEAICDVLVKKTMAAASAHHARSILVSGGVAANLRLRQKFMAASAENSPNRYVHVPPVRLCTDNAVYIASYAFFRGKHTDWQTVRAIPDMPVEV